jgi:putative CocE/NonD family hydrolase
MGSTSHRVIVERSVPFPMRDGTVLYADVYRPDEEGRFPVLLQRTPYDKGDIDQQSGVLVQPFHAAMRGYVVVIQDLRGRHSSEGEFDVFFGEVEDGHDTVEWAANLPYSSGKVGMFGGSYSGATQISAAISGAKSLVAISPRQTSSDYHDGWVYQGGAFMLGFNFLWSTILAMNELTRAHVPSEERRTAVAEFGRALDDLEKVLAPIDPGSIDVLRRRRVGAHFYEWLQHPNYDAFWEEVDPERHYAETDVAGLHLGGWYDIFLRGTIRNYLGFGQRARAEGRKNNQKLVFGPWIPGPDLGNRIGEWNSGFFSSGGALRLEEVQFRWFDHWLKGEKNGIMDEPPVMIYVMGENKWRTEADWPVARATRTNYYLHGQGHATTLDGDGTLGTSQPGHDEPTDAYVYDPEDPVPTLGGGSTASQQPALPSGVFDQRPNERREDVLVYTTSPLEDDTEVTGPVSVVLWASSSAPDTDFTAKLVDVHPDGYARNLCDGVIRARFRESMRSARLLVPGEVYEFAIDLVATSNVFRRDHRIRVEISSSNFPKFDRNPNSGLARDLVTKTTKAVQTVHHTSRRSSRIVLPIVSPA